MTAIELVIASVVMLVALLTLASSMGTSAALKAITRENSDATDAAGNMLERLWEVPFDQVYRQYNSDPQDDLDGVGTAPGHRFGVEGLTPLPTAADGMVGEILFPQLEAPADSALSLGSQASPALMLREDFVSAPLGMPRDLNGDLVIDELDHAQDYFVLPIQITLRWLGANGDRELTLYTMLSERPRQ